jgi:hypothetical protein
MSLCEQLDGNDRPEVQDYARRIKAVETLDSDSDGFSNFVEILAGAQPGWTVGAANPIYSIDFKGGCSTTSLVESAPSWVKRGWLDPVSERNIPPVAVDDSVSVAMNTPLNIDILANDFDLDADTLEVLGVSQLPDSHGGLTNNVMSITYAPETDFCGIARFQYQITDGIDASNQADIAIHIGDTVPPVVIVPSFDLELSLAEGETGISTSRVDVSNWLNSATAEDAEDGTLEVSHSAADHFNPGTTIVKFWAVDSCGTYSYATASVIVHVVDNNSPVISMPTPNPLELNAENCALSISRENETISNWLTQATASDLEDGDLSVTHNAPVEFLIGRTPVNFIAKDSLGETALSTALIIVNETPNDAPIIYVPAALEVFVPYGTSSLPNSDARIQDFLKAAIATDGEDGELEISHDAPDFFDIGTTLVRFSAVDSCGKSTTIKVSVVIQAGENNSPVVIAPKPDPLQLTMSLCAETMPQTTSVITEWLSMATATDIEDGELIVEHDAPEEFPVGNILVHFTATDSENALGLSSAMISVNGTPNTVPTITPPSPINIAIPFGSRSLAATDTKIQGFLLGAAANDAEDGRLAITHDAPKFFEEGSSTVNFTSTDSCGVVTSASSTVMLTVSPDNDRDQDCKHKGSKGSHGDKHKYKGSHGKKYKYKGSHGKKHKHKHKGSKGRQCNKRKHKHYHVRTWLSWIASGWKQHHFIFRL